MKTKLPMIAVLAIMISGCATVRMADPLGGPLDKPLDPAAWNGTWLVRGGLAKERASVMVRVIDPTSGTLRMAWIEDEKEQFKLRTAGLVVRQSSQSLVVSMKDENPDDKEWKQAPWLLIGIAKVAQDKGLIWPPDVHAFSALVKADKLPGTSKDENTAVLKRLKPAQQDLITSSSTLFTWDSPTVLEKID